MRGRGSADMRQMSQTIENQDITGLLYIPLSTEPPGCQEDYFFFTYEKNKCIYLVGYFA